MYFSKLTSKKKVIPVVEALQRRRTERWQGRSQKCEGGVGGKIMVATTFLATIKNNWIFTMRVKMFMKDRYKSICIFFY
jgi:hypothetical protein